MNSKGNTSKTRKLSWGKSHMKTKKKKKPKTVLYNCFGHNIRKVTIWGLMGTFLTPQPQLLRRSSRTYFFHQWSNVLSLVLWQNIMANAELSCSHSCRQRDSSHLLHPTQGVALLRFTSKSSWLCICTSITFLDKNIALKLSGSTSLSLFYLSHNSLQVSQAGHFQTRAWRSP